MMNPIYLVILGEIALVGVTAAILLSLFSRGRKKNVLSALESLLTDIKKSETVRRESFGTRLTDEFRLTDEQADNISGRLVQNEKSLYQSFIKTQLDQSSQTMTGLQNEVSRLTDDCLDQLAQHVMHQYKPNKENTDEPPEKETSDENPTNEVMIDSGSDDSAPDSASEPEKPEDPSSSQTQPATDSPEDPDQTEIEKSNPPEAEQASSPQPPPTDAADDNSSKEIDETAGEISQDDNEPDQSVSDEPNPDEAPDEEKFEIGSAA